MRRTMVCDVVLLKVVLISVARDNRTRGIIRGRTRIGDWRTTRIALALQVGHRPLTTKKLGAGVPKEPSITRMRRRRPPQERGTKHLRLKTTVEMGEIHKVRGNLVVIKTGLLSRVPVDPQAGHPPYKMDDKPNTRCVSTCLMMGGECNTQSEDSPRAASKIAIEVEVDLNNWY